LLQSGWVKKIIKQYRSIKAHTKPPFQTSGCLPACPVFFQTDAFLFAMLIDPPVTCPTTGGKPCLSRVGERATNIPPRWGKELKNVNVLLIEIKQH